MYTPHAPARGNAVQHLAVAAAALVVVAAALGLAGAAGAGAAGPTLSLLGDEPLVVNAKQGEDQKKTSFWILNSGPLAHLALDLRVEDYVQPAQPDKRLRIASWTSTAPQHDATRVNVVLAGLSQLRSNRVDAQFVLTQGDTTLARAVTITPAAHPAKDWPKLIPIGSAVAAGGIILAVILLAVFRGNLAALGGRAPGAKWGFDSWGASLTVLAGIFGTVAAKATLPPVPDQIDQDTLAQLNLLFAVMLVVGPFIFQAIRRPVVVDPHDGDETLWGYSPVLLVAYAISGAAVLGELACLALLTWEMTLGSVVGWVLIGAVALLGCGAAYYAVVVAYDQVSVDWDAQAAAAAAPAAPPGAGPPAPIRAMPKLYARML